MSRHISFGWANFLQALAFAAFHGDPPRLIYYLVFGLLAGWLAGRTRALSPGIAMHATINTFAFIAMQSQS